MKLTNDAVEKWASDFRLHCSYSLTKEQSLDLISIFMNEQKMEEDPDLKELCEDPKKGGLICMMWNRCKALNIDVTRTACLFLNLILKTPGEVTMVAAYMLYLISKKNFCKVNVSFICSDVFPAFYPSNDEFQKLWENQKVDYEELEKIRKKEPFASDNILDYKEAYQSIMRKS